MTETKNNYIEERPWGKFESLRSADGYQVKILTIKPGAKLSLQSHNRREEHWVVARGTAKVISGGKEIIFKKSSHIFIPVRNKHRIENPGKEILEIIEVQIGDYLGEDDIIRYEDLYRRDKKIEKY